VRSISTIKKVIAGKVATKNSEIIEVLIDKTLKPEDAPTMPIYNQLMEWADKYRKLNIRTNADQPEQAEIAIIFGAEGIGLCRTEHMFFGGERIDAMREMILADDIQGRKKALEKLLPYQRDDFYGLFKAMGSRPVTIRLLDPPLHEFLPHDDSEIKALALTMGKTFDDLKSHIHDHHEFNPMLGLRGCRLGILHPEITIMQVRAIIEAACRLKKEGLEVVPEIMVPLISTIKELEITSEVIHKTARSVIAEQGIGIKYLVGTMIEVPRAAITSDQIATAADFFSYGTNDLTQMTLGMSRDDSGQFLPIYQQQDIFARNPFESIDKEGVGRLMSISAKEGRAVKPELKLGICGEHGGDPSTVEFCHQLGLNYVSCSPFRVPIARLAAARAALSGLNR